MKQFLRTSLLALALISAFGQATAATHEFRVDIDTRSLSGLGFLDLQFNAGQDQAADATATVANFQGNSDGSITPEVIGSVSGALPSRVSFTNEGTYNDYFHAVQMGGKFAFKVSFSGDYFNTPSAVGSTFSLSMYAADRSSLLGNGDSNSGSLLTFQLAPNGNGFGGINATVFDNNLVQVTAVPEPEQWALMAGGLMALGFVARRRKQQA